MADVLSQEELSVEFAHRFAGSDRLAMLGQVRGITVAPAGIPVPPTYRALSTKAQVLTETMGIVVDDLFVAIWYPRYAAEVEALRQWIEEKIANTVAGAGELGWVSSVADPRFGWTSVRSLSSAYCGWLEYVIRKLVEKAAAEGWSETYLAGQLEGAWSTMLREVQSEVLERLGVLARTVPWYDTFFRKYFLVSVGSLVVVQAVVRRISAHLLRVKYVVEAARYGVNPASGWRETLSMVGSRIRLIADPGTWAPILGRKIVEWVERVRNLGGGSGVGVAAATMIVPGMVTSAALALLATVLVSLGTSASEAEFEEHLADLDALPEEEAATLRRDAAVVVAEVEDILRQVEALTTSLKTPFRQGEPFGTVSPSLLIPNLQEAVDALGERVANLTLPGAEGALAPIKKELARRLSGVMGKEVRGAEEVTFTDEELATFVDPLRAMEFVAPHYEDPGTDDEAAVEAAMNAAVERAGEDLELYAEEVAARIMKARGVIAAPAWAESALVLAAEGMELMEDLLAGESIDRLAYATCREQLANALQAGLPSDLEGKVRGYYDLADEAVKTLNANPV